MKKFMVFVFILVLGLISCHNDNEPEGPLFETVNFSNLNGNDIYLVKVNKSDLVVNATDTGGARVLSSGFLDNRNRWPDREEEFPLMDYPPALEFNANPLPIVEEPSRRLRAAFIPPVIGDTRNFWVEPFYGRRMWVEKQATLRATGLYGNIWVMDENYSPTSVGKRYNQITTEQAKALADKFDLIYPAETNLLGFEYSGGPGGDGGKDGDPKIQILVYDIVDIPGNDVWGGFFWSKDFYQQTQIDSSNWNLKTNLAEIFYVNTRTINNRVAQR